MRSKRSADLPLHLILSPRRTSFRLLNHYPWPARVPIQASDWDRLFFVWHTRRFPRWGAHHGSRPGRCGLERFCEAVQGEDRGEEEAGPITVGASSGLCVFDGIGEREGEVAGGQGKSAGGVERIGGSGEDGIAPCRLRGAIDLESFHHHLYIVRSTSVLILLFYSYRQRTIC